MSELYNLARRQGKTLIAMERLKLAMQQGYNAYYICHDQLEGTKLLTKHFPGCLFEITKIGIRVHDRARVRSRRM